MAQAMDLELTCRNLLWLACMRCCRVPWRLRVFLPEVVEEDVSLQATGAGPAGQTRPQEDPATSDNVQPTENVGPSSPSASNVDDPHAGQTTAPESPADSSDSWAGTAPREATVQTPNLPPSPPGPQHLQAVRGSQPRARRQLYCPDCASRMVLRQNRTDRGWLYGRSKFPQCRSTMPALGGGVPPEVGGVG